MSIPRWSYVKSSNLQVGGRAGWTWLIKNLSRKPLVLGSDISTFQKQWENEWVARANCFFSAALMNIGVMFRCNTIFGETKVMLLKCNSQCFLQIKLFIFLRFGLTSMFLPLQNPPIRTSFHASSKLALGAKARAFKGLLGGGGWESLLHINRYEDFRYFFPGFFTQVGKHSLE